MAPFWFLGQDACTKIQHDFHGIIIFLLWCHMTLMTTSVTPLHLLVQDDQNDMQH